MARFKGFTEMNGHSWFEAEYPGRCKSCDMDFVKGELVTYVEGQIIAATCCSEVESVPVSNGADFDSFHHGRPPGIAVLPRGKTGKDKCPLCFIVPASNGACGCE